MSETRGKKTLADLTMPSSLRRLVAPPHLTKIQREFFDDIVRSLPSDYFLPSDVPLLCAYCAACDLYQEALAHINEHGQVIEPGINDDGIPGRMYANPSVGLASRHASTMQSLAVRLRLNPSSRISTNSKLQGGLGKPPWDEDDAGGFPACN